VSIELAAVSTRRGTPSSSRSSPGLTRGRVREAQWNREGHRAFSFVKPGGSSGG
jgi:hypothetical protein